MGVKAGVMEMSTPTSRLTDLAWGWGEKSAGRVIAMSGPKMTGV